MDTIFNVLLLLILFRIAGDFGRDLFFNPLYKMLERWTQPFYSLLNRVFLQRKLVGHLFLLALLIFLRGAHYFSYRTDIYAFQWGPCLLLWQNTGFIFALHKALFESLLFYIHFLLIYYLIEWITRGVLVDPLWKLFRSIFEWARKWTRKEGGWQFFIVLIGGSLFIFLLLFPFSKEIDFVPALSNSRLILLKILILNIYLTCKIFSIYFFLFLVRAILSWIFPIGLRGPTDLLIQLTEPVLRPFYRLSLRFGAIDFTLLFASFLFLFLHQLSTYILARISYLL